MWLNKRKDGRPAKSVSLVKSSDAGLTTHRAITLSPDLNPSSDLLLKKYSS